MKNLSKLLFTTFCLGVILLTSCNIGLGAAVDTQPPEISISHPAADAQTRSTIILDGTWNDDLSVASITTVLREVETKKEYEFTGVKAGTSDTEGTWTCTIDPLDSKNPVPDGTYVATVTAEDTYGHKGNASVTFSIDNTVPLIVLSSPSTTEIGNPTAFGQVFTVEGKAADDSDIDSVDVIIYDTNNVEVGRKTISNVSTQIDVNVAEWGDDVYKAVYGENKEAGTKGYYIGIVAYDGARKVPAEEGDRGNCATYFYMNNDFASLNGFKTSTAYKILNGSRAANDYSDWITLLESKKIEKATISLNPVNNPYFEVQNFEPITVGKENELEDPSGKYKYINKSAGSINLFVGRDKKSIKVDTIGIYLRECDVTGKLVKDGKVVTVLQPYTDKDGNVYKDANGKELITKAAHDAVIQTVGSTSYKTSFTLNVDEMQNLSIGTYYIWDVVAFDYNNIGIRNDSIYAIKMASSSAAPSVTITNPTGISKTIAMDKGFDIKGNVKTELNDVAIRVYIDYQNDDSVPFASTEKTEETDVKIIKTKTSPESATTRTWDFELHIPDGAKKTENFSITIIVSDPVESGIFTRKDIEISNDRETPTFGDYSISPTVEIGGVSKVNGTITVKQAVDDNNIVQNTWYSLDSGKNWTSCGKTTMMTFDVDTTKFDDKTDKIVWLKAQDSAGNIKQDEMSLVLHIDQSTDLPKVELTNANDTIDKAGSINTNTNLFGTITNNQLIGTVTDDDGIDRVYVAVKKHGTSDYVTYPQESPSYAYTRIDTTNNTKGKDISGKTSHNLAFTVPNVEGIYDIEITVWDSKQHNTGFNTKKVNSFVIGVDTGAPNLTITTPDNAYQPANNSFALKGSTNDDQAKIGIYKDADCKEPYKEDSVNMTPTAVTGDWSYSITTDDGTNGDNGIYTLYVRATDTYGQATTQKFIYKIDAYAPTFSVTELNTKKIGDLKPDADGFYHDYATANSLYTIRGTVIDKGPSGLADKLYYLVYDEDLNENDQEEKDPVLEEPQASSLGSYTIDTEKGWKPAIISKNADSTLNSDWAAMIDLSVTNDNKKTTKNPNGRLYIENGKYVVYLAVQDGANNTSEVADNIFSAKIKLTVDSNKPVLYENSEDKNYPKSYGLKDIGADSYVYVIAKDDESGIAGVDLYLNGAKQTSDNSDRTKDKDYTKTNDANLPDGYTQYLFLVDLSGMGTSSTTINYTFDVRDVAGNVVTSPAGNINNNPPTLSITNPLESGYRKGEYYYTNKDIVFEYEAKATGNGISKFTYKETNGEEEDIAASEVAKKPEIINGTSVNGNAVTIKKGSESRKVDNVFTVTNKYNNSSSQTLKYIFDLEEPTVEVTTKGLDKEKNFFNASKVLKIEGTATDAISTTAELNSGLSELLYSLVKLGSSGDPKPSKWEDVSGTSKWNIKLDMSSDDYVEGDYMLFIKAVDNVGNESEQKKIYLVADKYDPEFKVTSIAGTTGETFATYYKDEVVIEGELNDTYLSKYEVKVNDESKDFDTPLKRYDKTALTSPQPWTLKLPKTDGKYTIEITAEDVIGNKIPTQKFTTEIDSTEPELQTADADNDEGIGIRIGKTKVAELENKWFNTTALSLSGSYLDNGSGVEKVTYTLGEDSGEIYTSLKEVGTDKYYKFSGTKDGFVEGSKNVLKVTASDKAGNTAVASEYSVKIDTTAPKVQGDLKYYVGDETTPNVYTNAILTNKGKSIKVTGSFSDENSSLETATDVSGIKNITAEVDNGKSITATGFTVGESSGEWQVDLDFTKEDIEGLREGTHTITLKFEDNAGNIDKSTTFAIKVDTVAPTSKFDSPSTTKDLNGKNVFSGSVKEGNNPKSIELRYVFSATEKASTDLNSISKWDSTKVIGKKTVGDDGVDIGAISSWKFEDVNVNAYLGDETKGYLYVLPIVYDEAGNCNIASTITARTDTQEGYSEFEIDLDSDRPTIKFTNLGKGIEYLKNTSTLTGSVTDDDGVAVLKISNSKDEPDWSEIKAETDPTTINFNLGDDGLKTLWFYIEDNAGGIFKTSSTRLVSPLSTPKLIYSSKTAGAADTGDNTGKIEFTTDSNAPTVGVPSYGWAETGDDATTAAKTADSTAGNYAVITTGDLAGGKLRKNIVFALEATDAGSQIKSTKVTSGTDVDESFTKGTGDIWYTAPIDVSTLSSGTRTFTFTVTDNAGLVQTVTAQLVIDNTPPVATLISPVDEVTGDVTLTGTTVDENSSVISTKYLVINNDNKDKTDAEKIAAAAGTIKEGKNASGWSFELNGKGTTPNAKLPANKTDLLAFSEITHDANDVYTLPIALVTEDILGNVGITETTITYNPYGDRPKTEITYPNGYWGSATNTKVSAETDAASYQNVNGSIRITGAATDNNSLSDATKVKVYFQLDLNNDGEFDDDDKGLVTADYTVVDSTAFPTGADASAIEDDGTFWGIAATGTNSWNFTLNSSGELQTDDTKFEDGKYKVGIRALTIDEHGVLGKWSTPAYFMIDMNAPQIGSASLVESATATVARSYQEDMFLKGTQYLKVPITDKTGIKKITYSYAKDLAALQASPAGSVSIELAGQTSGYEAPDGTIVEWTGTSYTAYIPVSTLPSKIAAANKSIALKVTAYKDSESESTDYQRYSMSFDNTAPDVSYIRFNADEGDEEEGSMKNRIVNNNGTFFTLAGKVHDDDSGFDKIAFYYYRDKQDNEGQKRRVYDPMMASTTSGSTTTYNSTVQVTEDASTDLYTGISKVDIKKNPTDTDSVPLYGYTKSVTVGENGNTITLGTALTDSDHIRAGGLVQINSIWHVISQIDTTKKVLTLSTATTATGTSNAFFPIAQVIDNTGSEKTQTNGELLDADSGDDGDGMPESIIKAGTYWTYDASIHSNYIPDGPGTLVTILWDKAGNVEFKTYTASVQNNAPRLTKLWLGTSLSSSMTESNFTEFDVLAKVGEQRSYEMETASFNSKKRFRVKGDLAVVTEFVGGNNATNKTDGSRIKMVYNNDSTSDKGYVTADATKSNVYTRDDTLSAKSWFTHSTGYEDGELENFAFKIPADKLGDDSTYTTDYSAREMSFTFWDITDETTQCKNSCYSYLKITDLIVMIKDTFAPTAAIDPFFWKSGDDNSLYQNSYKNGHIDLPTATGATLDTKTGLFKSGETLIAGTSTNKPQVSGIVSVRGSVLDEHALDSIWVAFTSNAATPESVFTPATSAYYEDEGVYYKVAKSTTTGWETKAGTFATETQTWTDAATPVNASGAVWKFTILSDVSSQEGQKVEWQLDIDTSAMTDGMGKNQVFRVMAKDKADDPHSSTETISGSIGTDGKYDLLTEGVNHPTYTVDVVPYVSSVSSVSGTSPNYVYTDAPRSKLGRYSVQAGQQIALKGFNFGSSTSTVSATKTIGDGKTASEESWTTDATRVDANTVIVTAPNYSGFINLTVGGIAVPNNTNSNTTYNIQEGYIASEADTYGAVAANNAGTNFWTDDVYVSVWNVGTTFDSSQNPNSGTMYKYTTAGRKQRSGDTDPVPANKLAGIWSADNSEWECILGNERYWGVANTSSAGLKVPPRSLDICLAKTTPGNSVPQDMNYPFFTLLDNTYDNSTCGTGFMVFRDRAKYSTNNGGKSGYTIDTQTSTTMYCDKYQNPKISAVYSPDENITGIQDGSGGVFHVYVSYYDVFSHCLKYASVNYSGKYSYDNTKYFYAQATSFTNQDVVVAGENYTTRTSDYEEEAGEWSDIDIDIIEGVDKPIPVIAYYNTTKRCLQIARGTTNSPNGKSEWKNITLSNPSGSSNFGQYVAMEMDEKGGLHIVAQDVSNGGKVCYGYISRSSYKDLANGSKLTVNWMNVDAGSNANWCDIKLNTPGASTITTGLECEPVIVFRNANEADTKFAVRVAYPISGVWESLPDAAKYGVSGNKLSIAPNVYDTETTPVLNKLAVGINSSMFAVDFLRNEK